MVPVAPSSPSPALGQGAECCADCWEKGDEVEVNSLNKDFPQVDFKFVCPVSFISIIHSKITAVYLKMATEVSI